MDMLLSEDAVKWVRMVRREVAPRLQHLQRSASDVGCGIMPSFDVRFQMLQLQCEMKLRRCRRLERPTKTLHLSNIVCSHLYICVSNGDSCAKH